MRSKIFSKLVLVAALMLLIAPEASALTVQEILHGRVLGASTPSLVQHQKGESEANAKTVAVTVTSTLGNDLIVVGAANTGGRTVASVTDNKSNTYVQATGAAATDSGEGADVWYSLNAAAGVTTITFTFSGNAGTFDKDGWVWEVSGFQTPGFDTANNASNQTGAADNTDTGATVNTTGSSEFVVGVIDTHNGISAANNPKSGNEFTAGGDVQAVTANAGASLITSTAGSHTPVWLDSSPNATFGSATAAFKETAAADVQAPSVPISLSATSTSQSQINLSWTASTDNVGVTGYTIYRGGVQVGTSATNSYSDTGLTASTQYTYTVDAYDASGNHSAQSGSASATTKAAVVDTTPPSTPTNLSATAVSSSGINLSWTASTDNVAVTGYKIFRGGVQVATSNTNSYSDAGLNASTLYSYTVSAYDAAGNNSSQSSGASATTQAAAVPGTVIDPSRRVDWTQAGVTGGIPNLTTICATLSAGATAAQINTAIANCASGGVVKLNAGNYTLNTGLTLSGKHNIVLRGAVPDQTFLKFTGSNSCGGWGADICVDNGDTSDARDGAPNQATWTAGYSVGTTSITIGSVSSGSMGNLQVGSVLFLDRLDDASDTGNVFACGNGTTCSEAGYLNGRNGRGQTEPQTVTSISGSGPWTVGISPGIRMPNEAASHSPGAYWFNGAPANDGIENLSIDISSTQPEGGIMFHHASNSWVDNIRSLNASNKHIWMYESTHVTVRDSYFYGTQNALSESYGTDPLNSADILVENNIFQHIATPMMDEGCTGCVYGYDFGVDDYYGVGGDPQWQQGSSYHHAMGDDFILWEGNNGIGLDSDDVHGTSNFFTAFRNYWNGRDPQGGSGGGKTEQTTPVALTAYNRFYNLVGNVLGTAGYHNTYQVAPTTVSDSVNCGATADQSIYVLGYSDNEGCHGTFNNDLTLAPSLMRWGNYDTVSGTVKWNTAEVPSGLAQFANPVPSSQVLPASLYLAAKPAWWPASVAWPPDGPDVSGGNLPNVGGHANMTPAEVCYVSVMGGSLTSTSPALTFNANNCYSSGGSQGSTPTISSFSASPTTITSGSSATLSWSVSGATSVSIDNGLGAQAGTSVSVSPTVTTTYTLTASNSNGSVTSQVTVTVNLAPDTTAPTVSITSPAAGTITGTITFSATASDPTVSGHVTSGVKVVTISVDGSVFATSTTGSVSKSLDTTTLTNASHSLTATAVDNAGNNSSVATVSIIVNNVAATKYPRLITLTSLEGTSTIPSSTAITATVLSPSSGTTLETQTNLTATAGKYTVTFLASDPQVVNIRIKVNGYLSQLLTSVDTTVNSGVALSVPQLSAGDSNNDNVVNSLDYSLMNNHWLQNYPTADINGDGIVNSLDFAILKNNYNKAGN